MTWMVECYLCSKSVEEALTVRVDFGAFITDVCDTCAERGEEGQDVADPVTEDAA